MEAVEVDIGRNLYPPSGGSGGSTTIGGVSTSSLLAATEALNALFELVAPHLGVQPGALEARDGIVRVIEKPEQAIAWADACGLLAPSPLTRRGVCNPPEHQQAGLIDAGVGGVQIADVSVDMETGIVTLNEMVAVQDCGLIVNMKTAESQVYGGLIMGITFALFEEAIYDRNTGRMLNADMEFYRLAGLKDVGKLRVHLMTDKHHDQRGIIGLGEPPVISPGAAISNALANACGVRVPNLPLTPEHVLETFQKEGVI
jgi:xanthine dehydrogenase YagR molybdenum-binding subunit